jgi:endonuclease G
MRFIYFFLLLFLLNISNAFSQGIIIHEPTVLDTVILSSIDSITFTQSMVVHKSGGAKDSVLLSNIDSVSYDPTINAVTTIENFEKGSPTKTAYGDGTVTFSTGIWELNDALMGNSSADVKNGTWSIRTRNSGKLTMKFDFKSGAGTVSVLHAMYNNGFDIATQWQLWYSVDQGANWQQVDSTINTNTVTFQKATFIVNKTGFIRFELRKIDGTLNRINFDDFTVTSYGASNSNPTPIAASMSPTTDTLGGPGFTLTVNGSNFLQNSSVVNWNGNNLATTYVSSIKLTAVVPASFLTSAGTVNVTVFNANGGTSASLPFALVYGQNNPVPAVRYLTQSACQIGRPDMNITIAGNYFVPASVVEWNGTPLTTTYVSSNQITALVPANLISGVGTAAVTVYAPPPAGGSSAPLNFSVYNEVTATNNINITMGNPSGAVSDTNYPSNYLIQRGQFCTSYNRDRGIPNWVSWEYDVSWAGSAVRQDNFIPDPLVPAQWYHVVTSDYNNSGFSRGHMCPSEDRTKTQADNDSLFFMTNMIPQTQTLNGGPWEVLESYCRTLAQSGDKLFIYSGPYFEGGTGLAGYMTSFANNKVTVPAKCWKVIMVLPPGSTGLVSEVTTSTRCIAVIMNNDEESFGTWQSYRVSVDSVEALTGLDFFSNVPVNIQAVIEAVVDNQ